jgi:hypothetical protein
MDASRRWNAQLIINKSPCLSAIENFIFTVGVVKIAIVK